MILRSLHDLTSLFEAEGRFNQPVKLMISAGLNQLLSALRIPFQVLTRADLDPDLQRVLNNLINQTLNKLKDNLKTISGQLEGENENRDYEKLLNSISSLYGLAFNLYRFIQFSIQLGEESE